MTDIATDTTDTTDQDASGINIAGILAKKAMIVRLSSSCWSARVTDKEATRELLENKNAQKNAGSLSKALIDKKHLRDIREIIGRMKKYHNANTLPWDNDGGRLLPSTKYSDYSAFLRQVKRDLETAIQSFQSGFQSYVSDATTMLGDLYQSDDYPDQYELKEKFAIESDFSKVPESSDFRVDIPDYEQKRICKQIEDRVSQQHAESMEKVWRRIYNTIEHMHERLSNEDSVFRNSMVENITHLVDILPELNILENKALVEMTDELKGTLCGFTAEDLRKDKTLRKEVAQKSQDLMSKIGTIIDLKAVIKDPFIETDFEDIISDQASDKDTEDQDAEDQDAEDQEEYFNTDQNPEDEDYAGTDLDAERDFDYDEEDDELNSAA